MYRIRLGCATARMNLIPVRPLSAWEGQGVGSQARRMMYIEEKHEKTAYTYYRFSIVYRQHFFG